VADDGLLRGDFYRFEQLLAGPERETLHRVRDWLAAEVVPIANRCWERAEFPFELIPRFAELGIAGIAYDEVPGRPPSALLSGLPATCWPATGSGSTTTSAGSSPMPRRSTRTRAPGRSTR
jgi:alkylation response protein AidB-like acyl-CoA dehydrogenase